MGCGQKAAYDDEVAEANEKTWKSFQKLSMNDALVMLYNMRRLMKHVDETPQYGYIHKESIELDEFLKKRGL